MQFFLPLAHQPVPREVHLSGPEDSLKRSRILNQHFVIYT